MVLILLQTKIVEKLYKSKLPKLNNCNVGIIGLGYVGLPLALKIANQKLCLVSQKKINRKVIGYDIDKTRIDELNRGIDKKNIFSKKIINDIKNINFTNSKPTLMRSDVFIITVPTPINNKNQPDLYFLKEASKIVGECIKEQPYQGRNPIVIYESTVYPGVTEDICVPLIEQISGKKYNCENYKNSFYLGYSPERINPGDLNNTLDSITKVTSGCNKNIANWIDNFYKSFISAGTYKASDIRVAEAAKIIENTQRDINIALVNELAILFKKLNINTNEVLEAANTKWNFQKYTPGLVGGHCIGVDPYYLTHKAKEIGFNTKLISAGRSINDYMHEYLLNEILSEIEKRDNSLKNEDILILGLSYKSNCGDIRNSQLILLVKNMIQKKMNITIVDPLVNKEEVFKEIGLKSLNKIPITKKYSVIIFALYHKEFKKLGIKELSKISNKNTIIFDLTNNISGENVFNL